MTLTVVTELLIFNGQRLVSNIPIITQKIKFSIKDFFSKCYQIRRKLRIQSHLLKKSLMENFIFSAVQVGVLREDRTEFLRTIVSLHGSNENIA